MSNRTIYTAEFHTDAEWALLEIKAATPERALKKALDVDPHTLDFSPYEDWHRQAWAGALVLVTIVFLCSLFARLATRRLERIQAP